MLWSIRDERLKVGLLKVEFSRICCYGDWPMRSRFVGFFRNGGTAVLGSVFRRQGFLGEGMKGWLSFSQEW